MLFKNDDDPSSNEMKKALEELIYVPLGKFVDHFMQEAKADPGWPEFQERMLRAMKEFKLGGPSSTLPYDMIDLTRLAACILHVSMSAVLEKAKDKAKEEEASGEKPKAAGQVKNLLLGVPCSVPGYTPGPGYVKETCDSCAMGIWVGPHQIAKRDEDPRICTTVCPICAITKYDAALTDRGELNIVTMNPDSGSKYEPEKEAKKNFWKWEK